MRSCQEKPAGTAAARHFEQAAGEYRRALAASSPDAHLHEKLGMALAGSGDMPGAVREFSTAVRLDPRNAAARSNLGLARLKSGEPADAGPQRRPKRSKRRRLQFHTAPG